MFSYNNTGSDTDIPCNYYLEGSPLAKSTSVMDLGIEINSDLSIQSDAGSTVSKARQRVGVIF